MRRRFSFSGDALTVFAVNRSSEALDFELNISGAKVTEQKEGKTLHAPLDAVNTKENQPVSPSEGVQCSLSEGKISGTLLPLS